MVQSLCLSDGGTQSRYVRAVTSPSLNRSASTLFIRLGEDSFTAAASLYSDSSGVRWPDGRGSHTSEESPGSMDKLPGNAWARRES